MSKQDGGGFTSKGAADIAETISPDYYSDVGGDADYSGGGTSFSSTPTQTAAERADEEAAEAEGGSWQDADDSDDSGGGK